MCIRMTSTFATMMTAVKIPIPREENIKERTNRVKKPNFSEGGKEIRIEINEPYGGLKSLQLSEIDLDMLPVVQKSCRSPFDKKLY